MTIRRIKDPAGLLPDHIHIDFDGDSADAIADLLEQMTPVARVNALRRDHPLHPLHPLRDAVCL